MDLGVGFAAGLGLNPPQENTKPKSDKGKAPAKPKSSAKKPPTKPKSAKPKSAKPKSSAEKARTKKASAKKAPTKKGAAHASLLKLRKQEYPVAAELWDIPGNIESYIVTHYPKTDGKDGKDGVAQKIARRAAYAVKRVLPVGKIEDDEKVKTMWKNLNNESTIEGNKKAIRTYARSGFGKHALERILGAVAERSEKAWKSRKDSKGKYADSRAYKFMRMKRAVWKAAGEEFLADNKWAARSEISKYLIKNSKEIRQKAKHARDDMYIARHGEKMFKASKARRDAHFEAKLRPFLDYIKSKNLQKGERTKAKLKELGTLWKREKEAFLKDEVRKARYEASAKKLEDAERQYKEAAKESAALSAKKRATAKEERTAAAKKKADEKKAAKEKIRKVATDAYNQSVGKGKGKGKAKAKVSGTTEEPAQPVAPKSGVVHEGRRRRSTRINK
jgi:hypothetical protein